MGNRKNEIKKWAECNDGVIWIGDMPWQVRNKMLLPLNFPHTIKNVDRKKVQKALTTTNALIAHWTDCWDGTKSEWWWTSCDDKFYDLENIKNTDGRKNIRKGLRECQISRISIDDFISKAYCVHYAAMVSYGFSEESIITEDQFKKDFSRLGEYDGFEIWGAYVQNKLVAYATCLLVDNAVTLTNTRSDPDFHKYRPNNALIYKLTKHYLTERNVNYISNGPRTLLHQTTINSFLKKMGYRRIYARLNLVLSTKARFLTLTGIIIWGRHLTVLKRFFPKQWALIDGFLKINSISKSFRV